MKTSSISKAEKFRRISASNRQQGEDHEAWIERRLRLRRQAGSGCGTREKEDLVGTDPRGKFIIVSAKSFSGKTITLKVADLERLVQHAAECAVYEEGHRVSDEREPILIVGIVDQMFNGPTNWVLVPLEEWEKYE